MLFRWSIRNKLRLGVAMLLLIVGILATIGLCGSYSYRWLARSISYQRATELRLAADLSCKVGELRAIVSRSCRKQGITILPIDHLQLREDFNRGLQDMNQSLVSYKEQLREFESEQKRDPDGEDRLPEWETVENIERSLEGIAKLNGQDDWVLNEIKVEELDSALADLNVLTMDLPLQLHKRMTRLVDEVRIQYRFWIIVGWVASVAAVATLVALLLVFHKAIFNPLQILIDGSRRVARDGDFSHRIQLNTQDEVAELAGAMNATNDRFQRIRQELDKEIADRDELVKQRSKEVIRSEQLAAVGCMAAGVAHEINNPLTAVAWAAEALESRLHDIIQEDDAKPDDEHNEEITVLREYLRTIQDESFRCKGITDQLLDFARLGDAEKHAADVCELVQDVIGMVQHLGRYREKNIDFDCQQDVIAHVNSQEIKQVVLNLITNALDSVDQGGAVTIRLRKSGSLAELQVRDNGCGMTEEVMQQLFEPFFTTRRNGHGTGLGLSITYRIVQEHGGDIVPSSDGPGRGSQFLITLPLAANDDEENEQERKVA